MLPASSKNSRLSQLPCESLNEPAIERKVPDASIVDCEVQRLSDFYEGKTILLTGATGYIGKVCLLKIVSSLSSCKRVYVLLRRKKGLTAQERFDKLLQAAPFKPGSLTEIVNLDKNLHGIRADSLTGEARARAVPSPLKHKPADWSKAVPIEGDMSLKDLGLAEDIKRELCRSVNIVLNIAASVQFDAPLKENLKANYMGTRNMLELATKFEKLISFVHTSTFFSNSHLKHIEERVVPLERDHEKLAAIIEGLPELVVNKIAPYLMEGRPNTYILSKAMAENLVQEYEGKLPIAIVRPSIVVPAKSFPEPGWVDNVNGPMGLGALAAIGILRNIDWNYWGICDFVPVDYVVNTLVLCARRTANLCPNEIKVYNCNSSSLSPITWGRCFESLRIESFKAPPLKMLRVPVKVPKHTRASRLGFALSKLDESLFAFFIDFLLILFLQRPMLCRLTARLHEAYNLMRPFTLTEYTSSNENLLQAMDELSDDDKTEFDTKIDRDVDWVKGFINSYYAVRKRILKEDMSNVRVAIIKMRALMIIELLMKCLQVYLLGIVALKLYEYASTSRASHFEIAT